MTRETVRKIRGFFALSLCTLAACLGIFWLVFILSDVLVKGYKALNWDLILNDPTPPSVPGGGLRNAFVGQLLITGFAALVGIPIGILGGTFLTEYARHTKFARIINSFAGIMMSIPTIVIGTFIYAALVKPFGHFSGWAGSAALAVIIIPLVMRTTEDMLSLVPANLREAAFALGAPYYKVIFQIVYRKAAYGIMTAILLSIARVAGEAAPLLFSSFNNSFFNLDMSQPMASLNVTIYEYATGPYEEWHNQAWAASFVVTIFILFLTISGRLLIKLKFKQ